MLIVARNLFVCITLVTQPPAAPGTSKTVDSLEGMGFGQVEEEEEVDEAAMESKIMMDIGLSPQAQPSLLSLFLKFVLRISWIDSFLIVSLD